MALSSRESKVEAMMADDARQPGVASQPPADGAVGISLTDVTKIYNEDTSKASVAIQGASFDVQPGEFVSLVGPSGCGKTTILRIVAGLLEPTQGTVLFGGSTERPTPSQLGMVFQQVSLLPWLDIEGNIMLPARILGIPLKRARERAHELMEIMQIPDVGKKMPSQLSGGMQQRASIARALLSEPDILLMDEPFGALDAFTREALNAELANLHRTFRKTVLFVTHDMREAAMLSDRVVVLSPSPARVSSVVSLPFDGERDDRFLDEGVERIRHGFAI